MHHPHVRYRRTTTLLEKVSTFKEVQLLQTQHHGANCIKVRHTERKFNTYIIVHITRSQAGHVAYCTLQTRLVRTLRVSGVNCKTIHVYSPWVRHCLDVYIRSLFMSSFRFSIYFWYLRLFYSDGFPYFIAPAFSTPAFSAPPPNPQKSPPDPTQFIIDTW